MISQAGFSYVLHEHTEYYHIKKWAQLEKRATVKVPAFTPQIADAPANAGMCRKYLD